MRMKMEGRSPHRGDWRLTGDPVWEMAVGYEQQQLREPGGGEKKRGKGTGEGDGMGTCLHCGFLLHSL